MYDYREIKYTNRVLAKSHTNKYTKIFSYKNKYFHIKFRISEVNKIHTES